MTQGSHSKTQELRGWQKAEKILTHIEHRVPEDDNFQHFWWVPKCSWNKVTGWVIILQGCKDKAGEPTPGSATKGTL